MNKVAELAEQIKDQPKAPLRPQQVADFRDEQDRLRSIVQAPAWQSGADRGAARQQASKIDKMLAEQSPKPIDEGPRRDKVAKLAEEVLTDVIRPSMLTRAEMRRNPAGAVDTFRRRENSAPIKNAILTWKRAMRALDPENEDQDYTNIERFRPEGDRADGAATHMVGAQIPGTFAMTTRAKENWPLGDPTADTALAQAQRVEAAAAPKPKKPMSEKQAASLIAARAALAASKAAKAAASVETVETEPSGVAAMAAE